MSSDGERGQGDKKVIHLDEAERLPAVPNSSQAAEVVKQIIEQILVNERRRARIEFVRLSVFFLVFLFVILGSGIWFARQLLVQLREERQLTEQTWRMMAGQDDGSLFAVAQRAMANKSVYPATKPLPPALDREEIAKLEQNIKTVSELLKTKPQSASASVRDMLQSQQNAIQALSARLNEAQPDLDAAPEGAKPVGSTAGGLPAYARLPELGQGSVSGGSIAAPLAKDLNLRMPIP